MLLKVYLVNLSAILDIFSSEINICLEQIKFSS